TLSTRFLLRRLAISDEVTKDHDERFDAETTHAHPTRAGAAPFRCRALHRQSFRAALLQVGPVRDPFSRNGDLKVSPRAQRGQPQSLARIMLVQNNRRRNANPWGRVRMTKTGSLAIALGLALGLGACSLNVSVPSRMDLFVHESPTGLVCG